MQYSKPRLPHPADTIARMFVLDKIAFGDVAPLSMQIAAGECVGLRGDSGCGKTRLLRALADMDEHAGSVALDGVDANVMPANQWRRQVALLPAESQWWHDTVGEHFSDRQAITPALETMGFSEAALSWQVSRCSSGEKQRLAILRLLANQPRVLLLDEPTANLDPDNTLRVERLIQDYIAANGAACLWVSHNRLQLQRVASRQLECAGGAIREVADG